MGRCTVARRAGFIDQDANVAVDDALGDGELLADLVHRQPHILPVEQQQDVQHLVHG